MCTAGPLKRLTQVDPRDTVTASAQTSPLTLRSVDVPLGDGLAQGARNAILKPQGTPAHRGRRSQLMADITITVPDEQVSRLRDALTAYLGLDNEEPAPSGQRSGFYELHC